MNEAIRNVYVYSLKYNKDLQWHNKYSTISSGYITGILFKEYMWHDIRGGRCRLAHYY